MFGNGIRMQTFEHKHAELLLAKLSQLDLKQKTPMAFNKITSEFYIVDNARNLLYRWNIITGKTEKQSTLNNRFTALFYSSGKKQLQALLWRMNTLFSWQGNDFVPTVRSYPHSPIHLTHFVLDFFSEASFEL